MMLLYSSRNPSDKVKQKTKLLTLPIPTSLPQFHFERWCEQVVLLH
jgi:hypothetical protein